VFGVCAGGSDGGDRAKRRSRAVDAARRRVSARAAHAALEQDRTAYEVRAIIRPTADLPLQMAEMAAWPFADEAKRYHAVPGPSAARWLEANEPFKRDLLERLRARGPLLSRDIRDTSAVSWQSRGWTGNRNVTQMLEFLSARGEVAISRRVGRQRVWDLAERVYPQVTDILPLGGGTASQGRTAAAGARHRATGGSRSPRRADPRGRCR
jgi:hypothetical protein